MSSIFTLLFYVYENFVSFLFNFIFGDLGFSYGFAVLGFFILSLLISYLIPGVSSHVSTIRSNRK